ncbi:MAG: peptidoglycan-binding protein [Candidatus Campbellbacteria bacterium]|nr:peptidoglycan-binding protein [Candidatus Campbellbacteria bacterium]
MSFQVPTKAKKPTKSIAYFLLCILALQFLFLGTPTIPASAQSVSEKIKERQAELEGKLKKAEGEIDQLKKELDTKKADTTTIQSEVDRINRQISQKQSVINQHTAEINKLSTSISRSERNIARLNIKTEREKEILSEIMRSLNETDKTPYIYVALAEESISVLFNDINDHKTLHQALTASLETISEAKQETEETRTKLLEERREEEGFRSLKKIEQREIEEAKSEKQKVLDLSKKVESLYEEIIVDREKEVNRIRAELFELRGSAAISFGEAVEFAELAQKLTGIRPAFLLGIIKIETELGRNLGTGNWREDMHPVRDRPVFEVITKNLGLNPDKQPVSRRPSYGWGGAMGPAQFIPSTWACYGGYVNRMTNSCGVSRSSFIIDRSLETGDVGSDVRALQRFLNKNGFTVSNEGEGSPGQENNIYGRKTANAVTRLQETYRSVLLDFDGLTRGTGTVGPRTQYFINRYPFWTSGWYYVKSKDKIREILDLSSPSNPWNPRDALVASAVYLKELKGINGKTNECTASRKYLAGGNFNSNVAWGYCKTVTSYADEFQRRIDFLSQ